MHVSISRRAYERSNCCFLYDKGLDAFCNFVWYASSYITYTHSSWKNSTFSRIVNLFPVVKSRTFWVGPSVSFSFHASDLSIRVGIWSTYLIIYLDTRREVTLSLSFGFMLFHLINVCFLISSKYHLWRLSSLRLCIPTLSHLSALHYGTLYELSTEGAETLWCPHKSVAEVITEIIIKRSFCDVSLGQPLSWHCRQERSPDMGWLPVGTERARSRWVWEQPRVHTKF